MNPILIGRAVCELVRSQTQIIQNPFKREKLMFGTTFWAATGLTSHTKTDVLCYVESWTLHILATLRKSILKKPKMAKNHLEALSGLGPSIWGPLPHW